MEEKMEFRMETGIMRIYIYMYIGRDRVRSFSKWVDLGFLHKGIIRVLIGDPVLMILRNTRFRTWGQLWAYDAKIPDWSSTRGGFSDLTHVFKPLRRGHLGVS